MVTKRGYPCRDIPDGLCYCRCHAVSLAPKKRRRHRPNAYLPSHDALVRAMVEQGDHPAVIAATLSERFGIARTEGSVRQRMRLLGLSSRVGWWSRDDVIRLLGIPWQRLVALEQAGRIDGVEYGRWRRYRLHDLEELVRSEAGRGIDPRRVRDRRLRALAETAALANRRSATS